MPGLFLTADENDTASNLQELIHVPHEKQSGIILSRRRIALITVDGQAFSHARHFVHLL